KNPAKVEGMVCSRRGAIGVAFPRMIHLVLSVELLLAGDVQEPCHAVTHKTVSSNQFYSVGPPKRVVAKPRACALITVFHAHKCELEGEAGLLTAESRTVCCLIAGLRCPVASCVSEHLGSSETWTKNQAAAGPSAQAIAQLRRVC